MTSDCNTLSVTWMLFVYAKVELALTLGKDKIDLLDLLLSKNISWKGDGYQVHAAFIVRSLLVKSVSAELFRGNQL